ncbi:hypothetical protein KIM67_02010 [Flagellimonas sp. 389]|uniref:hypothetical protein n=1 Tax=Flagellimonas sp. 389 TaxID=2835862 RepID=UPI001BD53966|nr:hypothetical protein [Flagellimonas sp. 389]MBS9461169.1 hypothetical protein [Flagellimonas sp. 389]
MIFSLEKHTFEQRTTNNEQRTTNNEQRTTNNEQRTTPVLSGAEANNALPCKIIENSPPLPVQKSKYKG